MMDQEELEPAPTDYKSFKWGKQWKNKTNKNNDIIKMINLNDYRISQIVVCFCKLIAKFYLRCAHAGAKNKVSLINNNPHFKPGILQFY